MIKKFDSFVNESVKDMMKPKATEDIIKSLEKMKPYEALAHANKYKLPEVVKIFQAKVKPINDKLIQDSKKYNKKNLSEFVDFVCTWMDDQGGQSYEIYDTFVDITNRLGDSKEEGGWEEGDEGDEDVFVEPHTVDSIYSDNTVKSFKQLLMNYVIDELSNTIYESEEDDGDEYEEDEIEDRLAEQEEMATPEELTRDQKIKLEVARMEKEKKEKDAKKPINKIKNFLGFNKKEEDKK